MHCVSVRTEKNMSRSYRNWSITTLMQVHVHFVFIIIFMILIPSDYFLKFEFSSESFEWTICFTLHLCVSSGAVQRLIVDSPLPVFISNGESRQNGRETVEC